MTKSRTRRCGHRNRCSASRERARGSRAQPGRRAPSSRSRRSSSTRPTDSPSIAHQRPGCSSCASKRIEIRYLSRNPIHMMSVTSKYWYPRMRVSVTTGPFPLGGVRSASTVAFTGACLYASFSCSVLFLL